MDIDKQFRRMPNVIEQDLSEYADTARLMEALWPYRDYQEVRDELRDLKQKKEGLNASARSKNRTRVEELYSYVSGAV